MLFNFPRLLSSAVPNAHNSGVDDDAAGINKGVAIQVWPVGAQQPTAVAGPTAGGAGQSALHTDVKQLPPALGIILIGDLGLTPGPGKQSLGAPVMGFANLAGLAWRA